MRRVFLLFHDFTVNADGDDLPGDEFAAVLKCFLGRHLQTAAAWNLHSYNGHALNVVVLKEQSVILLIDRDSP